MLSAYIKGRCTEFHCFGVSCVRNVAPPGQEHDLDTEFKGLKELAP
jgi:hypothetical protein